MKLANIFGHKVTKQKVHLFRETTTNFIRSNRTYRSQWETGKAVYLDNGLA